MSTHSRSWTGAALVAAGMVIPMVAQAQSGAERVLLNQTPAQIEVAGATVQFHRAVGMREPLEGARALLGAVNRAGGDSPGPDARAITSGEQALLGWTRRPGQQG